MRANLNEPLDLQPIPVEGIVHKVGVDMIGPLQFSASGNCYINTKVHYMTKNVKAAVVLDRRTMAELLDREVICRQSMPAEAVSDQGGDFLGDLQALLDRCATSPYHS